jgi:hypothetical protein
MPLCRRNNQLLIKIGDKEVDFSPEFKLYITTKLANPHYTPEVSTKAMIVNFTVKESGLEAQLLNTVVKCERPDLDKHKNDLVVKVSSKTCSAIACIYCRPVCAGRVHVCSSVCMPGLVAAWHTIDQMAWHHDPAAGGCWQAHTA